MKPTSKYLLAAGLVAGALSAPALQINPAHAQTKQVDCELVYKGVTKIKGRCDFESKPEMGAGSFRISKTTGTNVVAGEVNVTGKGVGDGIFQTEIAGRGEAEGTGEVRRNGACWSNEDIKICALALTPTTAKLPAKKAPTAVQRPPSPNAAPAKILGTWLLSKQDNQDISSANTIVTFTANGKHTWGPMLQKCVYTYKAPDNLKTDCSKSVADFVINYKVRSVNATTLVLVNPQVDQVSVLTRQP